jgi:P4 family phage/plasmid primase-like protien
MKKIGKPGDSVSNGDLMSGSNVMKIMLRLKTGFKDKIMKECQRRFYDSKFEEKLDSNRHLIGFENGVYDLNNGYFRPGSPDDCISFSVGYNYEEYSLNHEYIKDIDKFFSSVQREKDMKEYILKLMASYLDGFTKTEQFVLWTGSGGNGKSKAVELFQLAFGDYCDVVPITLLTQKRKGSSQASPEMAKLRGKRFVVFQEPENTDEIQVGCMKELTGGDTIYARPLYKDPIKFKPQFKLLLTCNKLPYIPSTDGGTWRRLRVSPWESEFVDVPDPKKPNQFKKDYDLTDKLNLWKKAFLWYLMKVWYPKYKTEGLNEPAKVTQFTNNYKKDSDVFFEFLDSTVDFTKNDNHCEELSTLYSAMKYWYNDAYSSKCRYNKKDLAKYLTANNYNFKDGFLYGVKYKTDNNDAKQQNELDD